MAREFGRAERVGDFLQRELATIIQQQLRDPRLGMVSVNAVKVSRDIAFADVFVTVLGSGSDVEESIQVLNKASGFIRTQVAKVIQMRTTPKLRFKYDESVDRGRQLSDLIDRARKSDRQLDSQDDSELS